MAELNLKRDLENPNRLILDLRKAGSELCETVYLDGPEQELQIFFRGRGPMPIAVKTKKTGLKTTERSKLIPPERGAPIKFGGSQNKQTVVKIEEGKEKGVFIITRRGMIDRIVHDKTQINIQYRNG